VEAGYSGSPSDQLREVLPPCDRRNPELRATGSPIPHMRLNTMWCPKMDPGHGRPTGNGIVPVTAWNGMEDRFCPASTSR
jgi:hypothetical protein